VLAAAVVGTVGYFVFHALVGNGLHDELRPGRPRPISDERVAQLVRKLLETKPKDGTHWSVRQMAKQTRLSKSTVHRIWHTGLGWSRPGSDTLSCPRIRFSWRRCATSWACI
jgi:Homeodomain-like domain